MPLPATCQPSGTLTAMCGRYAASRRPEDLVEQFEITAAPEQVLPPSYNVAPTDQVYAVLERAPREDRDAAPTRQLRILRWGLVPSWAHDASVASTMINSRVETVTEKPAYRQAFAKRRCLLPADGYFEWYADPSGRKQPFFIRPRDGSVLAMAALYEFWRDPAAEADDAAAWLVTCSVITTTAVDELGRIHDRMPMFVDRDCYAVWLDPAVHDADQVRSLLVPAAPGALVALPVSKDVGNVRNNAPHLIEPVAPEALEPRADVAEYPAAVEQEQLF